MKKQEYCSHTWFIFLIACFTCAISHSHFNSAFFLDKLCMSISQNFTAWFKLRNHMWFKFKNGACMYVKALDCILCLYPTLRVTKDVFCFQVWDLTKVPLHPDLLHLPTWIYQMRSSWKTSFVIYHC